MGEPTQLPDSPYPGIEPYRYSDRKIFFAREAESRTLLRLIVMYRGVLLYSDSGNGKSSLINAGLIPLAIEEGLMPQRIRVQPRSGQEIVFERLADEVDGKRHLLPSITSSNQDPERTVLSVETLLEVLERESGTTRPLLIFDQFEEWTTLFEGASAELTPSETRAIQGKILDAIVSLINDSSLSVKVLISLREDYLAKLTPLFRRCPSLPDQYLRLIPLDARQIHRVIRGPFEEYPERYPGGISSSLADEIRRQFESRSETGIRLTEVQVVCQSLFQSGKQGKDLEELFMHQGGVQGILEQYTEQALDSLPSEQREPAVCLLARMVTSAGTRNVISGDDLLGRVEHEDMIPRELLGQTLVRLERDTKLVRREQRREVYYYEIASEFLVDWIRRKAQEGQVKAQQRELAKAQRAAEEMRRARRQRQLLKSLTGVGAAALLVAAVAWNLRNRATREAEESHSRRYAQLAKKSTPLDPQLRLLLALHAVSEARGLGTAVRTEASSALSQVLREKEPPVLLEATTVPAHTRAIAKVVFSPNGNYLATGSEDNTVKIWEVASWWNLCTVPALAYQLIGVAFTPDSARLAVAQRDGSRDGSVVVWEVSSGRAIATLSGSDAEARGLSFPQAAVSLRSSREAMLSADGSVTSSPDGKLRVVGRGNGELTVRNMSESITAAAFSPDGSHLATGNQIGTVRLWDAPSGRKLLDIPGETGRVLAVAFSPDGAHIAAGTAGKLAKATGGGPLETVAITVWDVSSGRELETLQGKARSIGRISFSRDGALLATVNRGDTVGVWNASSGAEVLPKARVIASAFSPDGKHVVTVNLDGTVETFDASSGQRLKSLPSHGLLTAAAFSQDGTRLATASWNSEVTVRETESSRELGKFSSKSSVQELAFAIDGARLLTAEWTSGASFATVRDVSSGEKLYEAPTSNSVLAMGLSSNGRQMLTVAMTVDGAALRVDTLDVRDLVVSALSRVERSLSLDECRAYNIVHAAQCEAAELLAKGDELAKAGRLEEATAKFRSAQGKDRQLKLYPERRATQLAAEGLVRKGLESARQGNPGDAKEAFGRAEKLSANSISENDWNGLCWFGSLGGQAKTKEVLDACNCAVEMGRGNFHFRDSRGLALALAGDVGGAIEDFEAYVKDAKDPERVAQRQAWIAALQQGKDPFTPEVLKTLFDDF